jgi:hypothetical protein
MHQLQRVRIQEFQIESGTKIIKLLVSFDSDVCIKGCCKEMQTLESGH